MFWKKNIELQPTMQDKVVESKNDAIWDVTRSISKNVKKVYIITNSLKLYITDSPDYNYELKLLNEAKEHLRNNIACYDDLTHEYREYLIETKSTRVTTSSWFYQWPDSHTFVQRELENLIIK